MSIAKAEAYLVIFNSCNQLYRADLLIMVKFKTCWSKYKGKDITNYG